MAKQIKRRRGTTVDHTTTSGGFIGANGEITVDTDKYTLVVHDDITVGGWPILREDLSNIDPATLNNIIENDTAIGTIVEANTIQIETNRLEIIDLDEKVDILTFASVSSILGLSDTPSSFGTVGQILVLNVTEDALEFADVATTFQELLDTATFGPPDADKILKVNVAGDGIDLGIVLPTFGTAASEDIDFFATGAEGDLAVTALQTASLGTSFFITEAMLAGALISKVNDSFQNQLSGTAPPTQNDDITQGFSIGSFWIDIVSLPKEAYRLVDDTPAAAIWLNTTLTTGELFDGAFRDVGLLDGNLVEVVSGTIDPSLLPATVLLDITNESILDLSDTPSSYIGQANKLLRVNPGATAVEFIDQPSTTRIEDSSGKTFVDTVLNANIVDIWASDGEGVSRPVAAFIANNLAILGEKLTFSNDSAKATIAATNTSGTGAVNLVLKPQLAGEIVLEADVVVGAASPGFISSTFDNSFTVAAGAAVTANAGNLTLRGGNGAGAFLSGNVNIQGGTGGAADGNVIINGFKFPTVDGFDGDVLITDGIGNLSFSSTVAAITSFQDLTDADDYTVGDADKVVKVNAGGTGIEFGIVLGTAAGSNIGDFATAAQGSTADSAVQPGDAISITEAMLTVAVQNKLNDSILNKLDATVDPTNNEDAGDGYEVGSLWINVSTDDAFINVDSTVASAIWDQINITGSLGSAAFADTADFATAAQGTLADNALPISGGILTGTLTLNNDPVADLDAATKQFVESHIFALGNKIPARAATTAALSGTYTPANEPDSNPWTGLGTSLTLDGVILANNDRLLVKDETTNNKGHGIFEVSGVGVAIVLNRVEDANNLNNTVGSEVIGGMHLFVTEGTINQDTGWVMSTPDSAAVLGTDAIEFVQFSNRFTSADELKLDGIETDATANQTDGEIKTAYENNADTNAFTDANVITLAGALQKAGGTMTGDLTLNADPTVDLHAATKQYVDNTATGLDLKESVRAATTVDITLSGTQTVDTVSLIADDRVLVKNQGTASQNGIYDVKAGAWVRSFDADNSPSGEVSGGMFTFVEEGGQAGTGWVMNSPSGIANLGVDPLVFVQFSDSTAPVSSVFGRTGAVVSATSDYDAIQIDNTPAGTISATNVQAAIDELDSEKLAVAGDTMDGDLTLDTGVQILGDPASPVAAPTYSFTGDVNTGIRSSGDDVINLVAGGADRLGISATVAAFTVPIEMNSNKITELGTPTVGTDAANKDYVDTQITAGSLDNVVEDLTPQLGGSLDVNGQSIVSVSAGDIVITPDTTGKIILDGLNWPQADGTIGQVLETDGAGNLSFTTFAGGSFSSVVEDTTPQLGGQLDVNTFGLGDGTNLLLGFVEDASAVNYVEIENEASGSGPTIRSVGADTDIDLHITAKGAGFVNLGSGGVILNAPLHTNNNNIIMIGSETVDGRDLSVDGAKLDLIDANANNYSHPNHTGDVTSTGDGATVIAADAVTYAKMQNVVADERLLGNVAGAGGVVAELDQATVLTFLGVETGATADQTGAEIKVAYEGEANTNAFTDTEKSKLTGIETGATTDQTALDIRALGFFDTTNDGTGSGLDADLLDGNEATAFATSSQGTSADSALQDLADDLTPQLGGQLDAQNNKIVSLATPTADADAATKLYVDSLAAGLDPKESVRVATTADLSFSFVNNGGVGDTLTAGGVGTTTIDTILLADANRVLVKDQGTATQNGIYVASNTAGGSITVLTRATDQDGSPSNEVSSGNFTFVELGSANGSTGWVVIGDGTIIVNTNNIDWAKFSDVSGALVDIVGDTTPQLGGNLDVNGFNITMPGTETVDGRDLSVDGAKLDLIEASATADQTAADIKALGFFDISNDGTGSGLDADLLDGNEASAFATAAQGSLADSGLQNIVEDTTPQLGGQLDVNTFGLGDGTNLLLDFVEDASAVNYIEIENEATGSGPTIRATGADSDVDFNIESKGTGAVRVGVPELTGTTPVISATGTDTNIDLKIEPKGTGTVQIGIPETIGTAPIISAIGTDTDIDLKIEPKGTGSLILDGLSWPTVDGTNGQALTTDGAGNLSFTTVGAGSLDNVVEDTTPQLGGSLDVNGQSIVSVSNGDIAITPDGSGSVILDGLSWPQTDGTNGQILETDGAGNLSFVTSVAALALQNIVEDTTPQLGGQLDVNTFGLGDGTNLLLDFVEDASAVNHIEIENEATGSGPIIRSAGTDTNVDLNLEPKGTGTVSVGIPESTGTTPVISATGADTNIDLKIEPKGTGTIQIGIPESTGTTPTITATGADTNIGLKIEPKGTGTIQIGFSDSTGTTPTITATGADTNIDLKLSPKGTGSVDVDTSKIINVTDPISAQDAATKNYIDTQGFVKTSDNNTYTKAQRGAPVAIASSATITPDFDAGNNFEIDTIATNFTLVNPTNMTNAAGQSGAIVIVQDGTGSRLLSAVGGFWRFPGGTLPVLSTAIGSVDTITYYVRSSTFIVANVVLDAQ